MEGLPIDIGRGCSCEGSEDNMRAVGIITRLAEDICHKVVKRVDHSGLPRACTSVHNDKGGRGP